MKDEVEVLRERLLDVPSLVNLASLVAVGFLIVPSEEAVRG